MLLEQLLLVSVALSAGVSVHLGLMSRIHSNLPEDIKPYKEYLHAGAFFPDSYYNCLGLDEEAEAAHWPPFLLRAAQYYHELVGANASSAATRASNVTANTTAIESRQFRAFMYGVMVHQIADSTWHSIRMKHGLLQHVAAMEFADDISEAHSFLDTGGDMILLRKLSGSSVLNDGEVLGYLSASWSAPFDGLVKIYHSLGFSKVNNANMRYCLNRGYAGLNLELQAYQLSSLAYLQQYPYLGDILDEYYLGGLEEIEVSSMRCMGHLTRWFDGELDEDPWSLCGDIVAPSASVASSSSSSATVASVANSADSADFSAASFPSELSLQAQDDNPGFYLSPMVPNSRFGRVVSIGEFLGPENGLSIAVGAPLEELDGTAYVIPLSIADPNAPSMRIKSSASIKSIAKASSRVDTTPNRYGYRTAKYTISTMQNNDTVSSDYLIVTSPGNRKIDILLNSDQKLEISFDSRFEQIGLNLQVADINGDGIEDIIVSSPYASYANDQSGVVVVLDGQKVIELVLGGTTSVSYNSLNPVVLTVPESLKLESNYENYGSAIATSEHHLYVGLRGVGAILVYDMPLVTSPQYIIPHGSKHISKFAHTKLSRARSRDSGQFGSSFITAGTTTNGKEFVLVGAHSETYSDCIKCGVVYLYSVDDRMELKTKISLKGNDNSEKYDYSYSKFGFNGVVANNTAYIASPTLNSTGAIWKFNVSSVLENTTFNSTTGYALSEVFIKGVGKSYSGFGESLATYHDNKGDLKLVVGMPNYGYHELNDDAQKFIGRVSIYDA